MRLIAARGKSGPGGEGLDLEQHVRRSQARDTDEGLRGRFRTPALLHGAGDWPKLAGVMVHHIRPELDDVAEVEPMGGKSDADVAERLLHLLGEVGRNN